MNTAFFSDLLTSISEKGRSLLGRKEIDVDPTRRAGDVINLCEAVLSGRGEASGAALAVPLLKAAAACHNGMATFAEAGVSGKDG